jgi:RNA polymerase sigma-70 factor (ECF subfamily)
MSTDTALIGCGRMSRTDAELVRLCRQGDTGAYAELMRRHRWTIYGVAYAVLGSSEDAEDVVQEAFVRAYRAIHRYNPRYAFATWLRRIAVNCAINRLGTLRHAPTTNEQPLQVEATPEPGPHEQAAAAELQAQVRSEVAGLPLKQRLAVTLFHLDGMSLAETAQTIGCSVGAVKSHLHRARERLALRLANHLAIPDR